MSEEENTSQIPLPPASFAFIVLSLRAQAEMQLGLMHFGEEEEKPQPDLPLARHTIDLMAVLLEKTRGNLSIEEQRLLENSLTELRFRFVQTTDELHKTAAPTASATTLPSRMSTPIIIGTPLRSSRCADAACGRRQAEPRCRRDPDGRGHD